MVPHRTLRQQFAKFWTIISRSGLDEEEKSIGLLDPAIWRRAIFHLWGIIKERVYRTKPNNIAHLKELIEKEFEEFDEEKETIL